MVDGDDDPRSPLQRERAAATAATASQRPDGQAAGVAGAGRWRPGRIPARNQRKPRYGEGDDRAGDVAAPDQVSERHG